MQNVRSKQDLLDFISDTPFNFVGRTSDTDEEEYLHEALETLTDTQRRRMQMYFVDDFSYAKIAKYEGISKMAVGFSINAAVEKLKIFFE